MKRLLDTQILIRSANGSDRLPDAARELIEDPNNRPVFGVVSLWEIAIESGRRRESPRIDARLLRRGALDRGSEERPVLGAHAVAVAGLPPIHRDPFDRILVVQATVEGMTLLASDRLRERYPGPVQAV